MVNPYPELEEAWNLMCGDILDIKTECDANGISLVAFNVPARFAVCDWDWNLVRAKSEAQYDRTRAARDIEQFFLANDIPYIPILEPFKQHPDPCSLYFKVDGHLSPEGADYLAILIHNYLHQLYSESKLGPTS